LKSTGVAPEFVLWETVGMKKKASAKPKAKKSPKKRTPREDFSQAAARIKLHHYRNNAPNQGREAGRDSRAATAPLAAASATATIIPQTNVRAMPAGVNRT